MIIHRIPNAQRRTRQKDCLMHSNMRKYEKLEMFKDLTSSKTILRQILKENLHKAGQSLFSSNQTCDIMTKHMPVYKM